MDVLITMRIWALPAIILLIVAMSLAGCSNLERSTPNSIEINKQVLRLSQPSELFNAIYANNVELFRQSIHAGDSINSIYKGATPLKVALLEQRTALAILLLKAGARIDLGFDRSEPTALMLATQFSANKLVRKLLRLGVDIDAQDAEGYTALAYAVTGGHLSTLNLLLDAGASPNATPRGQSLLMHSVADNNMMIALPLIEAGANLNYTDSKGLSALLIARQNNYHDLDLMLVQAGARL